MVNFFIEPKIAREMRTEALKEKYMWISNIIKDISREGKTFMIIPYKDIKDNYLEAKNFLKDMGYGVDYNNGKQELCISW